MFIFSQHFCCYHDNGKIHYSYLPVIAPSQKNDRRGVALLTTEVEQHCDLSLCLPQREGEKERGEKERERGRERRREEDRRRERDGEKGREGGREKERGDRGVVFGLLIVHTYILESHSDISSPEGS